MNDRYYKSCIDGNDSNDSYFHVIFTSRSNPVFFPSFADFFRNKPQIVRGDQGKASPVPLPFKAAADDGAMQVAVAAALHGVFFQGGQDLRTLVALVHWGIVEKA